MKCSFGWSTLAVLASTWACAVALGSCSQDDPGSTPDSGDGPTASPTATDEGSPTRGDRPSDLWFVEDATARGLVAVNHCGALPEDKRYLVEEIGNGCCLFDADGDGDLDALLVDGCTLVPPGSPVSAPEGQLPPATEQDWRPAFDGRTVLYSNDGNGRFRDDTENSGIEYRGMGAGAVTADVDDDGDQDVYLTAWGPNRMFRNDGSGRFEDVSTVSGAADPRWSVGACFLDADRDGDLDLYVANYFALTTERDPDVWRKVDCPHYDMEVACGPLTMVGEPDAFFFNRGDGTFEDRTAESGVGSVEARYSLGVVAFDQEGDGDTDVYVANDSRGNYLFFNDGAGVFEEWADLAGVSLNEKGIAQAGMGIGLGDYDNDLDLDLFLTNFSYDDNTLYRNDGDDTWLDVTKRMKFGTASYFALGWGTDFVDFDLDGDLDLFVSNGHIFPEADARAPELTYLQPNRVFENVAGVFEDATDRSGPGLQKRASSRGAAFGDVDRDGDVDVLLVEMNEPPSLLINLRDPDDSEIVVVTVEGRGTNRDAVGTRIEAHFTDHRQMQEVRRGHSFASCNGPALHFGTGGGALEKLVVHWADGETEILDQLAEGTWIHLRRGERPAVRSWRTP